MTDPEKALALCVEAAEQLASVLPSSEELTVAGAQPGTEHVVAPFSAAVLAETDLGRIAVLVAEELIEAVSQSDLTGMDLPAAVRPALDAATAHLRVDVAEVRDTELALVVSDLGGDFTVVPLIGDGFVAALAVPRPVLDGAVERRRLPRPAPVDALSPGEATQHEGAAAAVPLADAGSATDPQPRDAYEARDEPPLTRPVYHQGGPVPPQQRRGIELLHGVDMEVTVELGRTRLAVRDLLGLAPGAVVELDRAAGAPADLLVNGRLIARGEVVVVDEDFGLRITEIVETRTAV
ncbi:flagellar motor switch protein FliN [Nocardioidaceae bacterium]|nr:flagellar motor switch protein FliN [Nocardioidaceae bacterium]